MPFTLPFAPWSCWWLLLFWPGRSRTSHSTVLGAETETRSRWRQPHSVALDAVGARNFNKELFLITFFSRETLLLITASLSCNEVQVFQDGLERYSQLIKVDCAPWWVFPPTCSRPDVRKQRYPYEELCSKLRINGLFSLHLHKKRDFFFNKAELKVNEYIYILRKL